MKLFTHDSALVHGITTMCWCDAGTQWRDPRYGMEVNHSKKQTAQAANNPLGKYVVRGRATLDSSNLASACEMEPSHDSIYLSKDLR